MGPGLFFKFLSISAVNRISLCCKKKIQTNRPNFTLKNTFLPKPQQKPGKNDPGTCQLTNSVYYVCKFDVAMLPKQNFCPVKSKSFPVKLFNVKQ